MAKSVFSFRSRKNHRPSGSFFLAALFCALVVLSGGFSARATVNEAISMAMDAAFPYVKEGFKVREDNWKGDTKSEVPLLVKHQLFRGNEYWFWAGSSFPGAKVTVGVFDDMGNSISLETFSKDGKAGARVLPKKTGTYFIRVTVKSKDYKKLDWGLIYGYR